MVTVDPNSGEYDKQMYFKDGYAMLYSPSENTLLEDKHRLKVKVFASMDKREVEALIENLQQVIDLGILDD